MNKRNEYDYIVIGGGTTGIVVAVGLATKSEATVCLLEAGPSGENDPQIFDYRNWSHLMGSAYTCYYTIEPQKRGNSRLKYVRARVLGGCSSHNNVIAFRTPDLDMQKWERLGATGWGPTGTRSYCDRVFKAVNITAATPVNECAIAFVEAAQQAGFPLVRADEDNIREGVVWLQMNVHDIIRQSSAIAYLFPLDPMPINLTVYTETPAFRIRFDDNGAAIGVETAKGIIHTRKEIIISAGVFESPKLLLLSGIGPASQLKKIGIPVIVDLPSVGMHLQDHLATTVMWKASRPIPSTGMQHWENALFSSTNSALDTYDLFMHFGSEYNFVDTTPLGYSTPFFEHAFCLTPNIARPKSEGVLQLRSADPIAPPIIDPHFLMDENGDDEFVLSSGIRIARRIAEQPALRKWIEKEVAPGPNLQSDGEIARYICLTSHSANHPVGTCRMGPIDSDDSVVDPNLCVRGVRGLRVADASIFPSIIGVNICITCMMIGEKCVDLILEAV